MTFGKTSRNSDFADPAQQSLGVPPLGTVHFAETTHGKAELHYGFSIEGHCVTLPFEVRLTVDPDHKLNGNRPFERPTVSCRLALPPHAWRWGVFANKSVNMPFFHYGHGIDKRTC